MHLTTPEFTQGELTSINVPPVSTTQEAIHGNTGEGASTAAQGGPGESTDGPRRSWAQPSPLASAVVTLLSYPTEEVHPALVHALGLLEDLAPAAAELCREAIQSLAGLEVWQAEELYCHTFDFSKTLTLEMGWHLFGEDYHRGAFLVQLRDFQRDYAVPNFGVELPDHLANLVLILDAMQDPEARATLVQQVSTALAKVLANFGETDNPYATVLKAVSLILKPATPEV